MNIRKLKTLLGLTANAKKHKSKMLSKLILNWCSMLLVVLTVIVFGLSIAGTFSKSEQKFGSEITATTKQLHEKIDDHFDSLMANVIEFSKECSITLSKTLTTHKIDYLNHKSEELAKLQRELFNSVNLWLKLSNCSGAFVILNATAVDENTVGSHNYRSCVYLRYESLSATKLPNQEVSYFRGMHESFENTNIKMHNRWTTEFNMANIEYLSQLMQNRPVKNLADSCLWSNKINLTDTWEDIFIVTVPLLDGQGDVAGLCGLEVSDLYFRLYYPATSSEFGNTFTLIAPYQYNSILTANGFHGGLEGSFDPLGNFFSVDDGKYFNIYKSDNNDRYYGKQEKIENIKTFDNIPIMLTSLLPESSFTKVANVEKTWWIAGSFAFFIITLTLSIILSRLYISPITDALQAIQNGTIDREKTSKYVEIDELYTYLQEKDKQNESTIKNLEQEKEESNEKVSTAQSKIDRLAYLRNKEINPDDFEAFLKGLKLLTPTEKEIYNLYVEGKSSKEILEIKNITENTLKYHNKNIYSKLSISSRKTLLQFATLLDAQKNIK